jgi:hypothetical protein
VPRFYPLPSLGDTQNDPYIFAIIDDVLPAELLPLADAEVSINTRLGHERVLVQSHEAKLLAKERQCLLRDALPLPRYMGPFPSLVRPVPTGELLTELGEGGS